jgi:hypothetical protein
MLQGPEFGLAKGVDLWLTCGGVSCAARAATDPQAAMTTEAAPSIDAHTPAEAASAAARPLIAFLLLTSP